MLGICEEEYEIMNKRLIPKDSGIKRFLWHRVVKRVWIDPAGPFFRPKYVYDLIKVDNIILISTKTGHIGSFREVQEKIV